MAGRAAGGARWALGGCKDGAARTSCRGLTHSCPSLAPLPPQSPARPDGGTRYQFGAAAVGKSATPKGEQTSFPTIPALLAAYRTPSKGAPGPLLLAVNRNIERSLSLSYSPAGRAARPQPAVARSRSVDDTAEAHPQDPPPTTHTWACRYVCAGRCRGALRLCSKPIDDPSPV